MNEPIWKRRLREYKSRKDGKVSRIPISDELIELAEKTSKEKPTTETDRVIDQGDKIPGSRFFRSFCCQCGEPIRVEQHDINKPISCSGCDGHENPSGVNNEPWKHDAAYHGGQFNQGEW